MKPRWAQETRGGSRVHVIRPHRRWRCICWPADGGWHWEARRFGRFAVHFSGEAPRLDYAKRIAVAASYATEAGSR